MHAEKKTGDAGLAKSTPLPSPLPIFFPPSMRHPLALTLLCSALLLAACETSSLTEEEKAPVPEIETPYLGGTKEIDRTQSRISFVGKSNIINHEGKFSEYTATITLDSTNPADLTKAKIEAEIDIASVSTDALGLNGHLLKEEFFSVEKFPKATFVSTSIVSKGGNLYTVNGDLTMKGTTKTIAFDAEITDAALTASYDLPRKDFGIGNDSYGNKLLEELVPVSIKLVFVQ